LAISLTAPGRDRFFELQDITVRLPGLAELVDESLKRGDESSKQDALMQLECLVQDLDDFATRSWPTPFDTSTRAQYQDFYTWLDSNASLGTPYYFSTWRSANTFCHWAMICLVTRLELQRLLLDCSHNMLMPEVAHRKEQVEVDIVRNLEDLCRGIPSQIGTPPHSVGIICSFHMPVLASKLLEDRGRGVEAQWCRNVLDRLRNDGFR
jgi:hypothetical protein